MNASGLHSSQCNLVRGAPFWRPLRTPYALQRRSEHSNTFILCKGKGCTAIMMRMPFPQCSCEYVHHSESHSFAVQQQMQDSEV